MNGEEERERVLKVVVGYLGREVMRTLDDSIVVFAED